MAMANFDAMIPYEVLCIWNLLMAVNGLLSCSFLTADGLIYLTVSVMHA
jgi:hypothetical protein